MKIRGVLYRVFRCAGMLASAPGMLLLAALVVAGLPPEARAEDRTPFAPGEKLTFALFWTIVPAGEAVLEVMPMQSIDGQPAYHFRLTAESNSFVDLFYKVRDRIDAFADADMTRSLRYLHKQHEGSTRRNASIAFDWQESTAQYSDGVKTKGPIHLQPGTFDPLSVFYYARRLPITENTTIERMVTDGVKTVKGQARIVKRETIRVPCGTFDTFLLMPDTKDVGGVFEKSKDADIKLWITADERRIPVKITSKVVVGAFIGELISIQSGTN